MSEDVGYSPRDEDDENVKEEEDNEVGTMNYVVTPLDRFKKTQEHNDHKEVREVDKIVINENMNIINETKSIYTRQTEKYEQAHVIENNNRISDKHRDDKYSDIKTNYTYERSEIKNKQIFDNKQESARRQHNDSYNSNMMTMKDINVRKPDSPKQPKRDQPDVSEILKQMKYMSDKQLILIDSIDKIQQNTKDQFDFMNNRINKLENTVNQLVSYIQNIRKDTNTKQPEIAELDIAKSSRSVFDAILQEIKVI
jgi:hypothetical protein